MPTMAAYLDAPALGWRLVRSLIGKAQPWMPRSIAADVRWMTGAELSSQPPESLPKGSRDVSGVAGLAAVADLFSRVSDQGLINTPPPSL